MGNKQSICNTQNRKTSIVVCLLLAISSFGFSQTEQLIPISAQATSANSGEKPQSKVWKYGDSFYSVFPNNKGTFVWKLVEQQWYQHLFIANDTNSKADCFALADSVFILLFKGQKSALTILRFDHNHQRYRTLNLSEDFSTIPFNASTETATIAVDSRSTLWLTFESDNNIVVRNSNSPYESWSDPLAIFTGVADDDISAIINMSGSIGVMWSNQATRQFGFKIHVDGAPIYNWSIDEVPASQSALNIGDGMSDDHLNLKYTSKGELFAAIKTSYDTPSFTKIGLLVRRTNGKWDDLYHISDAGTRPIVSIDEVHNIITVYYTSTESGGDIVYKKSRLDAIGFGEEQTLLDNGIYNNATSSKFSYRCHNIIMASDATSIVGMLIKCQ